VLAPDTPAAGSDRVVEQAALETPRGCPHCGSPRMGCVALASFEGEDRVATVLTSDTSSRRKRDATV
jgi:hypothetical protein